MVTAAEVNLRRYLGTIFPSGDFANTTIDQLVSLLNSAEEITTFKKDVAQTFNNDGTLANLTGLVSGTLPINTVYRVEVLLRISSVGATPGAEIKFVIPADATLVWGLGSAIDTTLELDKTDTAAVATVIGTGLVTAVGVLTIKAVPGTIQIQGAQGTPTVEDTDYEIESNMKLVQVA